MKVFGRLLRNFIFNLVAALIMAAFFCSSAAHWAAEITHVDPSEEVIGKDLPISAYTHDEEGKLKTTVEIGQEIFFNTASIRTLLLNDELVADGKIVGVKSTGSYKDCTLTSVETKSLSQFNLVWECDGKTLTEELIEAHFIDDRFGHLILPDNSQ